MDRTATHELAGIFKARRNLTGHPLWAQPTWTRPPDERARVASNLYLATKNYVATERGEDRRPSDDGAPKGGSKTTRTASGKSSDEAKKTASKKDIQAANQVIKVSQPPSPASNVTDQATQPTRQYMTETQSERQESETQMAVSMTAPVASLSQTSITSTVVSAAAKMTARIEAANVSLPDLAMEEDLARSTVEKDITAGRGVSETVDQQAELQQTNTAKPIRTIPTTAVSNVKSVADVTMSVEVLSDEHDWPECVPDTNITADQTRRTNKYP